MTGGPGHCAARMGARDHACLFYDSDEDRAEASRAFAGSALDRGERVVYTAADRGPETVLSELRAANLAVDVALASGQLELRDAAGVYGSADSFDAEETVAFVESETERALADGWKGLRIAGEMGWAARLGLDPDVLYDYERRVERAFERRPIVGLCLYDMRHFHADVRHTIAETHPLVLSTPQADPGAAPLASIERGADGALALVGEVDISNAPSLAASLRAEAGRRAAVGEPVVVDLSHLRFMDLVGLRALWSVASELVHEGPRVSVQGAPAAVMRAARMIGFTSTDAIEWVSA